LPGVLQQFDVEVMGINSGVELVEGSRPDTPVVSATTGQNRVDVTISLASGLPSTARVLIRVTAIYGTGRLGKLRVEWGDGEASEEILYGAIGVQNKEFEHTYTSNPTANVTVIAYDFRGEELDRNIVSDAIAISTDWTIDQVRIGKWMGDPRVPVRIEGVGRGWMTYSVRHLVIKDTSVVKGRNYGYTVEYRRLDPFGQPGVTSSVSLPGEVGPWA
jgi:hypothetical protein